MPIEIVEPWTFEISHFHQQTNDQDFYRCFKTEIYLMFIKGVDNSVIILNPIKKYPIEVCNVV